MKKLICLLILSSCILCLVHAQTGNTYNTSGTSGGVGNYNSFFGKAAGGLFLGGDHNAVLGAQALVNSGSENSVVGAYALNRGGYGCVAVGYYALFDNRKLYWDGATNDGGYYNTAVGYKSLTSNQFGDNNTALGMESLYANTTGHMNTGSGYHSLYSNTTGHLNSSYGGYALSDNISGSFNTATGSSALNKNTTGMYNTAAGYLTLSGATTGSYNSAGGSMSLNKVTTGSYNTGFGYRAGQSAEGLLDNTTAIGYLATPTASNQVRIGNTAVTSIGGYAHWTNLSDGRFKRDIKEDVSGLDFIKQLRPVSYTVDNVALNKFLHVTDSSINSSQVKSVPVRQTGFIAQEVEALVNKSGYVFSGVDAPENENDPYGIRYSEFVVPLVKAVQELTGKLEAQQEQITEQQTEIQSLRRQLGSTSGSGSYTNTAADLFQNNPNPFDAETAIRMTLPDDVGYATIIIYNLEGKQLKTIQVPERGDVRVTISANELSAGMYLYALIADGKVVDTKRMVLTR